LSTSSVTRRLTRPRREREQVARDLKPPYTAIDADAARHERFDEKSGARFPVITKAWVDATT
jgi:hypothetical protein